jgi:cell division protein FtsQ
MGKRQTRDSDIVTVYKRRRTVNGKRLALAIVLLALLIEVGIAAFTSPWLDVKRIQVIGIKTIPSADILSHINLGPHANIFRLHKRAIESDIRLNPVVAMVEIHRRPPGTIVVMITERKASFLLESRGTLFQVDASGVPFRLVGDNPGGLPIIAYELSHGVILGRSLKNPQFIGAMQALAIAREKKISRVSRISVDQTGDLCLNVSDEFDIKLGRAEQLPDKLGTAAQVIDQYPDLRKHGGYLDFTCAEAPALKLKNQ